MGLLHHPFWLKLLSAHSGHYFFNYFLWLRITDEGSIPEMRIWPILLIKSDLKWCIHLSRSLYLYFILMTSRPILRLDRWRICFSHMTWVRIPFMIIFVASFCRVQTQKGWSQAMKYSWSLHLKTVQIAKVRNRLDIYKSNVEYYLLNSYVYWCTTYFKLWEQNKT